MRLLKLCILVAANAVCQNAISATWFAFSSVSTSDEYYFFDLDTVTKERDVTNIWIKTVRKFSADKEGAWATASKWRVNCKAKTLQTITSSDYARNGEFIKSYNKPSSEGDIVPGSVGESASKVICASDFPRNGSEKDYFKLYDNDVIAATRRAVESLQSKQDSAPQ